MITLGRLFHLPKFRVITKCSDAQLLAIAAYQASLTTLSSMLMPRGSMCKTAATKSTK